MLIPLFFFFFFFNDTATTEIYTLSLHDALPIYGHVKSCAGEPVISEDMRAFAEHDDFGVRGGVTVSDGAIARAGDNFSVMHQNGADWDFARDGGGARFVQSLLHELEIVHFARD